MAYIPYPFEKTTCVQVNDESIIVGKVRRIGRYFSVIPASDYATIHFKTPANKITLYQLKEVNKTAGGIGGDFMPLLSDTEYTLKLANLATVAGNGNILIDLAVGI